MVPPGAGAEPAVKYTLVLATLGITLVTRPASAQHGRVATDTVRSASLANLLGDPPEARVSTYLPPSYDQLPERRYPVVYLLHGFTGTNREWGRDNYDVPGLLDSLITAHAAGEMIVVMPTAFNRFSGTFYVKSVTNGDWEKFISGDLVGYIDRRYRTIAKPESRGIAGHSMGGYGAFYLAMRHGGTVYGAMYALSACCSRASVGLDPSRFGAQWDSVATLPSFAALDHAGFFVKAIAGLSAAFSPDPARPPFFFDLEQVRRDGQWHADPAVQKKWDDHSTLLMVSADRAALQRMRGIAFDIGEQDQAVAPGEIMAMDSAMSRAGIPHAFETYQGDHTDKIRERLATRVFPFFTKMLVFTP
jgi:S-formylglutathione hydrolase FrmB